MISPGLKPCFLLLSSCPLTKTQLAEGVLSDSRKAGSCLASQRPHETVWPGPWPSSTWGRQGCLSWVGSPMPLSRTPLLWQSDHKWAGVQDMWIQSRGVGLDSLFLWVMVRPLQGPSRVDKMPFEHPYPGLSSWTHALFCPLSPSFWAFFDKQVLFKSVNSPLKLLCCQPGSSSVWERGLYPRCRDQCLNRPP